MLTSCVNNNNDENNNDNVIKSKDLDANNEKKKNNFVVPEKKNDTIDYVKIPEPSPDYSFSTPIGFSDNGHKVSLTFDDGPGEYTEQVLEILDKYNVKATFCMLGTNMKQHPDLVSKVLEKGHEICNHSFTHKEYLKTTTPENIVKEIDDTNNLFKKFGNDSSPRYYRAPEGVFNENTIEALRREKMIPLSWTVDSKDWTLPGEQSIINNVLSEVGDEKIILMHDGGGVREQTVKALPTIIEELKNQGYTFTTPSPKWSVNVTERKNNNKKPLNENEIIK